MEDPREIAWQQRCDQHSHNNAIRVAFTAIYTRAVPNARLEQYYKSRIPSIKQWVAAKLELENPLVTAEEMQVEAEEAMQDQGMPDADTGTDTSTEPREREKERHISGKRKNLPVRSLGRTKAVTEATRTTGVTKTAVGTRAAAAKMKKKRSELQVSLSARGQDTGNSEAIIVQDDGAEVPSSSAARNIIAEDDPPALIPNPSPVEPASAEFSQVTKKSRTKSAQTIKPVPNTKTKRAPKSRTTISTSTVVVHKPSKPTPNSTPKLTEQLLTNYGILPYVPGITEVIFNHYPFLYTQPKKRVDETASTKLDTGRLVLMCMKAAKQKNIVKAGAENSVENGPGELVFLRRNAARVKRWLRRG